MSHGPSALSSEVIPDSLKAFVNNTLLVANTQNLETIASSSVVIEYNELPVPNLREHGDKAVIGTTFRYLASVMEASASQPEPRIPNIKFIFELGIKYMGQGKISSEERGTVLAVLERSLKLYLTQCAQEKQLMEGVLAAMTALSSTPSSHGKNQLAPLLLKSLLNTEIDDSGLLNAMTVKSQNTLSDNTSLPIQTLLFDTSFSENPTSLSVTGSASHPFTGAENNGEFRNFLQQLLTLGATQSVATQLCEQLSANQLTVFVAYGAETVANRFKLTDPASTQMTQGFSELLGSATQHRKFKHAVDAAPLKQCINRLCTPLLSSPDDEAAIERRTNALESILAFSKEQCTLETRCAVMAELQQTTRLYPSSYASLLPALCIEGEALILDSIEAAQTAYAGTDKAHTINNFSAYFNEAKQTLSPLPDESANSRQSQEHLKQALAKFKNDYQTQLVEPRSLFTRLKHILLAGFSAIGRAFAPIFRVRKIPAAHVVTASRTDQATQCLAMALDSVQFSHLSENDAKKAFTVARGKGLTSGFNTNRAEEAAQEKPAAATKNNPTIEGRRHRNK